MADATCAETSWRRRGNWGGHVPCTRKAGHGPEGRYCKQHAAKFDREVRATWFVVAKHSTEPREVGVSQVTESTLIINGRRCAKSSDYKSYYETREAAIEAIRDLLKREAVTKTELASRAIAALADFNANHPTPSPSATA